MVCAVRHAVVMQMWLFSFTPHKAYADIVVALLDPKSVIRFPLSFVFVSSRLQRLC